MLEKSKARKARKAKNLISRRDAKNVEREKNIGAQMNTDLLD